MRQRLALAVLQHVGALRLQARLEGQRVVHQRDQLEPCRELCRELGQDAERQAVDDQPRAFGHRQQHLAGLDQRHRVGVGKAGAEAEPAEAKACELPGPWPAAGRRSCRRSGGRSHRARRALGRNRASRSPDGNQGQEHPAVAHVNWWLITALAGLRREIASGRISTAGRAVGWRVGRAGRVRSGSARASAILSVGCLLSVGGPLVGGRSGVVGRSGELSRHGHSRRTVRGHPPPVVGLDAGDPGRGGNRRQQRRGRGDPQLRPRRRSRSRRRRPSLRGARGRSARGPSSFASACARPRSTAS